MDSTYSGPDDSTFANRSHAGRPQPQPPGRSRGETFVPRSRSDDLDVDSEKTLRDYIEIVIRRRWAFIAVFIAIFLIAAVYTFSVTPLFNSVATIEFEEKKPKQEDRVYGNPEYDQYKGYLATQLEILKSRSLAEALVVKMNLAKSPEFQSKSTWIGRVISALTSRLSRANGHETPENAAAARINGLTAAVLGRVSVKPVKTSNLATVSMDATNPTLASQMLRNYLDLYLKRNLEKRRKESLEASAWLKEELAKVEKKLMESQAELVGFLIDNGIVVSSTETGVSPVMDLLQKTMETHTKSREARLRMQALKDQKVSEEGVVLPKNVNAEYVGKLKQQLALYESEYSEMKGLYSPSYPKMAMLNQKIKFLRERILEIERGIVSSALDTAKKEEGLFQKSVQVAKHEANRVKALDAQHMLLKKEVETNEEFHKILLKEYKENDIRARTINNNVRIVDPPSKPHSPRWPKKKLFLLIGTLMGLVGGIAAAFLIERLDNTVQTPEEIERDFRVRRLAIVPDLDVLKKLHGTELTATPYEFIAHGRPKSPMSDAIRNIQTSIFLSNAAHPVRCMVVSSPNPSQGKTLISVSIATVLCSGDKKVVMIDGDLRKPRVHRVFGHRDPGRGLSNLLSGNGSQVSDALHAHSIKGLFYITAGQKVSDHLPLLQSKHMKKLVEQLKRTFDYIIFDSPPILGFSDTPIICTYADGLIMVAKQGNVGRDELREAINETSAINGCAILGVVLNKAHAPGAYGYGYRYGFGYGHGYYYGNYKYYGDKS
jgi:polysaccharide biosynthesis transport protein